MFVIQEMFVEDKNLAKVLRALSGLVFDMGPPRPVNADRKGKQLLSKGGSAMELILNWFNQNHIKAFTRADIDYHLTEAGLHKNNGSKVLANLVKAKRIKRVARGQYEIIPHKKVKRNG